VKVSELKSNKSKCPICNKNITPGNVTEHVPCLETAHGFTGELSVENLIGLCLQKDWLVGIYGQDQLDHVFSLKSLDEILTTRDPVLRLVQYALLAEVQPKVREHKPKEEPEPPSSPILND